MYIKRLLIVSLLSFVISGCNLSSQPPTSIPPKSTPPALTPSTPIPPTETYRPPEHLIGIRQIDGKGEFYNKETGQPFTPRGVNYFILLPNGKRFENLTLGPGTYDHAQVKADFEALSVNGFNTIRIFLDSCGELAECIGNVGGEGLNPEYLDNIADVMSLAKIQGLFILFTSNDLPDNGGYWEISAQGESGQFAGYRNAHYLTTPGVESAKKYWEDVLSALIKREAPLEIILGWSLLNEQWYFNDQPPFSLTTGTIETANGQSYDMADPTQKSAMASESMIHYIAEVKSTILDYDPDALITMGFFEPDFPHASRIGDFRLVLTAPLLDNASLDFFDFHSYPGGDLTIEAYAQNYGMEGFDAKPIIMGEIGAFLQRYPIEDTAARAIQTWIADSCKYGFDGWLYWGYYRAPLEIGDATWGFSDGDGLMISAISPTSQPDPCNPTPLPGGNLALGRFVRASRSIAEEPPENVVDGGPAQWGAGEHPPQWIEIDLGAPATITEIRLWVAQYPAGETTHQIWGYGSDRAGMLIHEFSGFTQEGDILTFTPSSPIEGIQYVRLLTTIGPSWVAWQEVEIVGDLDK